MLLRPSVRLRAGVGQTIAALSLSFRGYGQGGGKSGLHRAGCQVTPGRRKLTTSATESKPPMARLRDQVRVKGCGKSAPRGWQQFVAR
jgi:hypothetical protein